MIRVCTHHSSADGTNSDGPRCTLRWTAPVVCSLLYTTSTSSASSEMISFTSTLSMCMGSRNTTAGLGSEGRGEGWGGGGGGGGEGRGGGGRGGEVNEEERLSCNSINYGHRSYSEYKIYGHI